MKRTLITLVVLFIICLIAYLLWPLKSRKFPVVWDEKLRQGKNDYLSSLEKPDQEYPSPNIILIVADDLGVNDISFFGVGKVNTPNIDGIGRAGAAFHQAYCASPVCSPSRAALLTGRYPQRSGFEFQIHDRYLKNRLEYLGFRFLVRSDPWHPGLMSRVPRQEDIDRQGLSPSEITIAEMLQKAGYATALVGKWHLGWSDENLPCRFGFSYQYGFFDSNSLYAPEGSEGITDCRIEGDFTDRYMWKDGRKGPRSIFRNCVGIEEKEHLTDAITRESIDFITASAGRPFFLMASYNAPHTPLQAPGRYVEMYGSETDPVKRVYYAMIRQLDDNIGKLMSAVDKLNLAERTLVIFLSDNGGATYTLTTDNGSLRGGKISDFEGGLRVPMFIKWPEVLTAGIQVHHPVIAMDIFSTIATAAKLPVPGDRPIDGVDLVEACLKESVAPHPFLYWQRGNSKAIRSQRWKAVWNADSGDTLLFDLIRDPFEENDLFRRLPDTARWLTGVHQVWSDELPAPSWPPIVRFREDFNGRNIYFDN